MYKNAENTILNIVNEDPNASQRKIAKESGISLGMVNSLMKKCVSKGFIKVENITPRTVKYILTPKGMNEKARKTLSFIKRSYRQIMEVRNRIIEIIDENDTNKVILVGEKDEMYEIISDTLDEKNVGYKLVDKAGDSKVLHLVWDSELENELAGVEFVNLLK